MPQDTSLTARLCDPKKHERALGDIAGEVRSATSGRASIPSPWLPILFAAIRALHVRLDNYNSCAHELADLLRDKWSVKDADAITIYCAALVAGIVEEWAKTKPENGFVHVSNFPDIGRVEIDIHRADGKSAAETIGDLYTKLATLTAERDKALADAERLLKAWEAYPCACHTTGFDSESHTKHVCARCAAIDAARGKP